MKEIAAPPRLSAHIGILFSGVVEPRHLSFSKTSPDSIIA
jgi:hypothetical protein